MFGWTIYDAGTESAFLQTGDAERDVQMIPPFEIGMRATHFWLLLIASYGLNSNAKWQKHSGQVFIDLGLQHCQQMFQLFYKMDSDELVLILGKVIDDTKVAGKYNYPESFLMKFNRTFKLGKSTIGPGRMRFFGIIVIQEDDKHSSFTE